MDTRIVTNADELTTQVLDEVVCAPQGLVSFATGKTFAPMFLRLRFDARRHATHLDEFLDCPPALSMAEEILSACPSLRGRFLAVPPDPGQLAAHEAQLQAHGGVGLQLLGLGRNGHLAFNEPGTPRELGFHVATLAPPTRADLAARFAPAEPPTRAVTAGLRSILSARRIVLVATGAAKAPAVEALLRRDAASPAASLHGHPNVLVLLDEPAARLVRQPPSTKGSP
jgi:glucosamine-6-phosphate deaminase